MDIISNTTNKINSDSVPETSDCKILIKCTSEIHISSPYKRL